MRIVRDIMEPNIVWVPLDMPVARAADELSTRQIGGAPVCSADGGIL
jgi:CBS domain-containing protein